MPGLDDYYKYIARKEQESEAETDTKTKKSASAKEGVSGNGTGKVRYVLRNGITVAIPIDEELQAGDVAAPESPVRKNGNGNGYKNGTNGAVPISHKVREAAPLTDPMPLAPEVLDYLPPIVEENEPPTVADVPTRPRLGRPRSESIPQKPLTDSEAAALWGRLPRHIQLLVGMEDMPPEEETAQKYYTRGFKESRRQLIERLLDPVLTLEDTARVLGVCPTTVRRYTNRGVLPHYRTIGQQRRFRLSDVLAFMETQKRDPKAR